MELNNSLYYKSAIALKLPVKQIESIFTFEVILGKHGYFFFNSATPFNKQSSYIVADNKYCMNKLLDEAGLPVPKATAYSKNEFNKTKIEDIPLNLCFPLVVKPSKGTALGNDVLCNIQTHAELRFYMRLYYQRHSLLSIEEFHGGLNSYRVLVFYNKVIAVLQRFPAAITGNGVNTVRELIELTNLERTKRSLELIKLDDFEIMIRLKELKITLDTVIPNKKTITIIYTCNRTRGGTTLSLGKQIHPENANLFRRAARTLNMDFVGFDVECEDILKPISETKGVIIEANPCPDIGIHEKPMSGPSVPVSKIMMRRLIYKHPLAFLAGLYRNESSGFYIKATFVFFTAIVILNLSLS